MPPRRASSARKAARRLAAPLLLLALAQPGGAQPLATAVKAAFLPKFARYVDWPPQARPAAGEALQLCIIGSDPFGKVIDAAAAGQRIGDNPITVRRLATAQFAAGCHIAFVRGTAGRSTSRLLQALRGMPVLTVTDAHDGSARGMIHFTLADGRVGFHVDAAAAARSRLSISSRLLGIALSVRQKS
ncbi:YfiR family protein [Allosphingosinicella sp.]|uniref:YfiR family protein n=1 Tax=Allosphingosinicella sp. TaxID=2823234 RepID=UPI003D7499B2